MGTEWVVTIAPDVSGRHHHVPPLQHGAFYNDILHESTTNTVEGNLSPLTSVLNSDEGVESYLERRTAFLADGLASASSRSTFKPDSRASRSNF